MRKIFLVGFMGVGKTTLGKRLANALKFSFLDADQWIEKKMNTSISEIFENFGDDYFRGLEKEALQDFKELDHLVIATGGGMPCFNDNIHEMLKQGIVVFLDRPSSELLQRLKKAKTKRPIIAHKTESERQEIIEDLLKIRRPIYLIADIVLDRNNQTIPFLIETITNHPKYGK